MRYQILHKSKLNCPTTAQPAVRQQSPYQRRRVVVYEPNINYQHCSCLSQAKSSWANGVIRRKLKVIFYEVC